MLLPLDLKKNYYIPTSLLMQKSILVDSALECERAVYKHFEKIKYINL